MPPPGEDSCSLRTLLPPGGPQGQKVTRAIPLGVGAGAGVGQRVLLGFTGAHSLRTSAEGTQVSPGLGGAAVAEL